MVTGLDVDDQMIMFIRMHHINVRMSEWTLKTLLES